jgi:N-acetylglucosamine-6-sulfatase
MDRRMTPAGILVVAALFGTLLVTTPAALAAEAPNVLVVMTDDQPYGTVEKMPFLASHADEFVDFEDAYTNVALCCPSRATFLSGLYSHHSGVETNDDGGAFDPTHTIATVFDDAGYDVGLFGKYLNKYPFGQGVDYVPPGYDRWVAFTGELQNEGAAYYNYSLSVDGAVESHGAEPEDYSTNVLTDYADEFLASADRPFFAMFTPYGPHRPFTAAPGDEHDFADAPAGLRPGLNQVQNDPHPFYANLPHVERHDMVDRARSQFEALQSEDRAIERFFETLGERGELDHTIVVFLSDNGYSLGAHRWREKGCLYDDCLHVPMMVRAPGIAGRQVGALISNVDLPGSIADLAGLDFGPTDGESLLPLMTGEAPALDRDEVLLRAKRDDLGPETQEPPNGWGIRTEQWKFIRYASGEIDLFDLDADPFELRDLARQPAYREIRHDLRAQLAELRG